MNTLTPDPIGREELLDGILADYLKAAAAGQAPAREALLEQHPDLVAELTSFFDDRDCFDRLAAPLRQLANGPASISTHIPGYELVAEIARGGMGVVWEARQTGLHRRVAIKMMRAGVLAGTRDLRRFQAEAEAVAALDHPRIAPVYEVGEHEGQPYLVMKFFEGGNLADALARFQGDDRQSARLVADIADGIHHAHRHGVLHRDLKPANILLDAEGRPHVSDFGLAKRNPGQESRTAETGLTHTGDLVGTPSYMAPEQARGDTRAVTVATDVYGLGAILYELLTGRPPFRGDGVVATLKQIQEEPPQAPRRIRPKVHRDLETICLKALEKEPGRRYPGVQALGDDLQRFLRGEPVLARAVGPLGQTWRWARRRPALAGLAALGFALVVALVGGFAAVTWQWRRAEKHLHESELNAARADANLQKAEQNFQRAHEAVSELTIRLSDKRFQTMPGTQPVRQALLETGLKYYEQFLAEKSDDSNLTKEQAAIWRRLGEIRAEIGKRDGAFEAFQRSRAILEQLGVDTPELQRTLAGTVQNVALLQMSDGQLEAALASFDEAEKLLKAAAAVEPENIRDVKDYAAMLVNKGLLCDRLGRMDQALECFEKQITLLRSTVEHYPDRADLKSALASCYLNYGGVLLIIGRIREGTEIYEKAYTILNALLKETPNSEAYAEQLSVCLVNMGRHQITRGEGDAALKTLLRARNILEKLVAVSPDKLVYGRELAGCCRETGNVHIVAKRYKEALTSYDKGRIIMERLVRRDEKSRDMQSDLAKCLFDCGGALDRLGKVNEAMADYVRAVEIRRKLLATEPGNLFFNDDLGLSIGNVAVCQMNQGHLADALVSAREAVGFHRTAFSADQRVNLFRKNYYDACHRLADFLLRSGQATEAVAITRQRLGLYPKAGTNFFSCACLFARAAAVSRKGDKAASAADAADKYDDMAMECLRKAAQTGYKDSGKMQQESDLESLRRRPDFAGLVAEVESNAVERKGDTRPRQ